LTERQNMYMQLVSSHHHFFLILDSVLTKCIIQLVGTLIYTVMTLPIVDISPFLTVSLQTHQSELSKECLLVAQEIDKACRNYGFLYIKGHGVPDTKLSKLHTLANEFFALPVEG
jgi:hypothetical protein